MSILDVETTAEAIQEDEELIEAVEYLVETAAVSLKSEIDTTIEAFWSGVIEWLEWLFPVWIAYKHDERLLWDDVQKLLFTAFLVAISFVMLAPRSRRRAKFNRRRRRESLLGANRHSFRLFQAPNYLRRHSTIEIAPLVGGQSLQQQLPKNTTPLSLQQNGAAHPRRPSSICSGRVIQIEEEETDRERFEKVYRSIYRSGYGRLVLPPECQLVEKHKRSTIKLTSSSSKDNDKKKQRRKKREKNDEDQPAKRLKLYAQKFYSLAISFLTYDYMGAGWTMICWLEAVLRLRQLRRSNSHPEPAEEDDDDDDESKASTTVSVNLTSSRNNLQPNSNGLLSAPLTPDRTELSQQLRQLDTSFQSSTLAQEEGEEKKESPLSSMSINSSAAQTPPPLALDGTASLLAFKRRTSEAEQSSTFSTPSQHSTEPASIGEPDEVNMAALRLPLSGAMSSKSQGAGVAPLRPSLGGKKKDLLENYRSSTASLLGSTNRGLHPQSTPATSQSTSSSSMTSAPPVHSTSSGDITTIHRNHQEDKLEEEWLGDSSDPEIPPVGRIQRMDSDFSASYYFETANTQESIHQMSIEAPLPDKNGYIVGDEFLPDSNCTPVLVFVNSRSGPQQGHLLITQLRRLLNPIQVWDLGEDGSPEIVLESFCAFRNLRILVCGGDGTVSWIIATLEKLKLKRKWPPISILPLGTGNDLARIHGWGGGYNNEALDGILEEVADSYISLLDRWEMTIENRKGKVREVKSFFNYLGVGADAEAALQVHMLRESTPGLFFSRVVNKAWYGIFGAEDIIKATSLNLPNEITLIADGVEVPLPPDSQGIILLNIDSYAGGAPIWSTGTKSVSGLHGYGHSSSEGIWGYQPRHLRRTKSLEDLGLKRNDRGYRPMDRIDSVEDLTQVLTDTERYDRVTACDEPSSCQDGVLDIVSIRSAFHLGQIRVGLSNAQRLCQCREATIHIKRKVALQIDGEPWRQNICTLRVKRKADRATMLHRSEDKNGVETEMSKLLDWAEERRLIDQDVHKTLTKEFSRRIEYKTRQRRNKANDNIMGSLKRAIGSTGAISSYGGNYEYP